MIEFKLNAHLGSSGWGERGRWCPSTQKERERETAQRGRRCRMVFWGRGGHLAEKAASWWVKKRGKLSEAARLRESERECRKRSSLHWRGSVLKSAGGDPTSIQRRIRVRVCVCVGVCVCVREKSKRYTRNTHTLYLSLSHTFTSVYLMLYVSKKDEFFSAFFHFLPLFFFLSFSVFFLSI